MPMVSYLAVINVDETNYVFAGNHQVFLQVFWLTQVMEIV
jgi:hypothetical protein